MFSGVKTTKYKEENAIVKIAKIAHIRLYSVATLCTLEHLNKMWKLESEKRKNDKEIYQSINETNTFPNVHNLSEVQSLYVTYVQFALSTFLSLNSCANDV